MERRLINIRRLVALDITLHGPRFIMVEFFVGTPAIFLFGSYVAIELDRLLGFYLLLTGLNYVPIVVYTAMTVKGKAWKSEVAEGLAANPHYVRKYSIQQFLVFVPFAIILLAVYQELMGDNGRPTGSSDVGESGPSNDPAVQPRHDQP